jgi:putative N-acetylmannosamine-6-phosphate epimerase
MTVGSQALQQLRGALIVSCQASEGEPLCAPEHIAALALSAINGGARGLRLEGADNVAFVRRKTQLPIVGLTKSKDVSEEDRFGCVYITPTFEAAQSLVEAGADIVALDATNRARPGRVQASDLIKRIKAELGVPVWADISTFDEGLAAAESGADVVSTTLSGYTSETKSPHSTGPDLKLLGELIARLKPLPVVLEGKVWYPEEVTAAFKAGAYAVVVGSAITRPQHITRRFVDAIPQLDRALDV